MYKNTKCVGKVWCGCKNPEKIYITFATIKSNMFFAVYTTHVYTISIFLAAKVCNPLIYEDISGISATSQIQLVRGFLKGYRRAPSGATHLAIANTINICLSLYRTHKLERALREVPQRNSWSISIITHCSRARARDSSPSVRAMQKKIACFLADEVLVGKKTRNEYAIIFGACFTAPPTPKGTAHIRVSRARDYYSNG